MPGVTLGSLWGIVWPFTGRLIWTAGTEAVWLCASAEGGSGRVFTVLNIELGVDIHVLNKLLALLPANFCGGSRAPTEPGLALP